MHRHSRASSGSLADKIPVQSTRDRYSADLLPGFSASPGVPVGGSTKPRFLESARERAVAAGAVLGWLLVLAPMAFLKAKAPSDVMMCVRNGIKKHKRAKWVRRWNCNLDCGSRAVRQCNRRNTAKWPSFGDHEDQRSKANKSALKIQALCTVCIGRGTTNFPIRPGKAPPKGSVAQI